MKYSIQLRWILIALSIMVIIPLIVTTLSLSGEESAKEPAAPQIIAVKFHADWCGSCKKMGTIFTDLQNKFDGKPVLFVTLDFTNRTTQYQSELLASALGMGEAYRANQGTGFILLLDSQARNISDRLTSKQTLKEMSTVLNQLLEK